LSFIIIKINSINVPWDVYNPQSTINGMVTSSNGLWRLMVSSERIFIQYYKWDNFKLLTNLYHINNKITPYNVIYDDGFFKILNWFNRNLITKHDCGELSILNNGQVLCSKTGNDPCKFGFCVQYDYSTDINYKCLINDKGDCEEAVDSKQLICQIIKGDKSQCESSIKEQTIKTVNTISSSEINFKDVSDWSIYGEIGGEYSMKAGTEHTGVGLGIKMTIGGKYNNINEKNLKTTKINNFSITKTYEFTNKINIIADPKFDKAIYLQVSSQVCNYISKEVKCSYPALQLTKLFKTNLLFKYSTSSESFIESKII
jgi:hypothetical protein